MFKFALKFFNNNVSISSCSSSSNVYYISAHFFCMQTQRRHLKYDTQVFTVNMTDINKTFKIKLHMNSWTKLLK